MRSKLTVVSGCMFSGKSFEFIRRINRARIAKEKVLVYKHSFDNRFATTDVVCRDNLRVEATPVSDSKELYKDLLREENKGTFLFTRPLLIGIDEVQFFDTELYTLVKSLMGMGVSFVVSGLDLDYKEEPFDTTAKLLCLADEVVKLSAVCTTCFGNATRTHRTVESSDRVLVGDSEAYTALCSECFKTANKL